MSEQEVILDDDVQYEEVAQPFIIETGDSVKVKQVLDDSLCDALTDPENLNWEANYTLENQKFVLMVVACASALVAQFYPLPFPESRLLLAICCASYFIISFVLQLIVTFIDKDCILTLRPKKNVTEKEVNVRTNFARFQEWFEIILEFKGETNAERCTTGKMYVGKYFTEKGEFDEEGYHKDCASLVQRFCAGKYQTFTFDHKSD